MSYVTYSGLKSPNDVLEKMYEYISSKGYTIVEAIKDDLDIYSSSTSINDGKKFVFKDKTNSYFICLRSANGYDIFGSTNDTYMETLSSNDYKSDNYSGIGMIVSEGYSRTQRWYNQFKVPVVKSGTDVLGCYIPITKETSGITYTLYCNNITSPSDVLIFTVMKENSKLNECVHLVVGNVTKYASWTGGIFFSGSANRYTAKNSIRVFTNSGFIKDCFLLPILGSSYDSNTFLRIDIDDATSIKRGSIYWASSGLDNITGKKMLLPIRGLTTSITNFKIYADKTTYNKDDIILAGNKIYKVNKIFTSNGNFSESYPVTAIYNDSSNTLRNVSPDIPSYVIMQSEGNLDWGNNINTLNCITTNMPVYISVLVDPDVLNNYAPAGYIGGVYFISLLNMQTSGTYEISYPTSGDICQVFPFGNRRGIFGFDGISLKQETVTP